MIVTCVIKIWNFVVENDEELTLEIQEQINEWFEAKFQERDVVLAINKFIEQKGMFLWILCIIIKSSQIFTGISLYVWTPSELILLGPGGQLVLVVFQLYN